MFKRRKNRKAYMMTLEAFFAFFITFMFVVFVVLKGTAAKPLKTQVDILPALEQRDDFRNCIYADNETCAELLVSPFIPPNYDFSISINAPSAFAGAKDIYTETAFIASNSTGDYKVVYLHYWFVG